MDPNNNSVNPNDSLNNTLDSPASGDTDLENIANDIELSANDNLSSSVDSSYQNTTPNETTIPEPTSLSEDTLEEPPTEPLYDPNLYSDNTTDPTTRVDGTYTAGDPTSEPIDQYTNTDPSLTEYDPNASPLPNYESYTETTPTDNQYLETNDTPTADDASVDNVMQEFNTPNDTPMAPLDPSPLSPPAKSGGRRTAMIPLVLVTILLFGLLLGSIWFFFLRGSNEGPQPTPTPSRTPTTAPTQGPTDTHLECRFGLCVEVPGSGDDKCASSFDCEQATLSPTVAPITTPTTAPTTIPSTVTPTPVVPTGTTVPTPSIRVSTTPSPSPTSQPTITPTTIPTAPPTPSPTPISGTIPVTGTTETTILFGALFLLALGAGFALLRRH